MSIRYFRKPKGYLLLCLLLLTAVGFIGSGDPKGTLLHLAFAVGTGLVVDLACQFILGYPKQFPDGALLTSLICALVLSDTAAHWVTVVAVAVGLLVKHAFNVGRRPLFNPAAFGLWIVLAFPSVMQSWWGGLSIVSPWWSTLLLIVGFSVAQKVRRLPLVLSFLFVYVSWFLTMGLLHIGNAGEAVRPPFINAALFLAFFMLTDPPTTPSSTRGQIAFGVFASLLSVVVCTFHGGLAYLFLGLLPANAWHAWSRRRAKSSAGAAGTAAG